MAGVTSGSTHRGLSFMLLASVISAIHGQNVYFSAFSMGFKSSVDMYGVARLHVQLNATSHPISNPVSGTNLWRLGVFGSADDQTGDGPRIAEVSQILDNAKVSTSLNNGQVLVLSGELPLSDIGNLDFNYLCIELAKNEDAQPDFSLFFGQDERPVVFCRNAQELKIRTPQVKQDTVQVTSFAVTYNIRHVGDLTNADVTIDATIRAAAVSIDVTPATPDETLWRLGFFGSRNRDGSGERYNYQNQLLDANEVSRPLSKGSELAFTIDRQLDLTNMMGPEAEFPYMCLEFTKSDLAEQEFFFRSRDNPPLITCQRIDCPSGFTRFQQSCYYVIPEKLPHSTARERCNQLGGDLASISDAAENNYVAEISAPFRAWIGGYREEDSADFQWLDGTPWQYENWRKREPNSIVIVDTCVEINFVQRGKWNDHRCRTNRVSVCKI